MRGKPTLQVAGTHGAVGIAVTAGPLERILPGIEVGPDAVVEKVTIIIATRAPPGCVSCEGAMDQKRCVRRRAGWAARKPSSQFPQTRVSGRQAHERGSRQVPHK